MILVLAAAAYIIAALCKIFSAHGGWIQWLLIVGGLLTVCAVFAYIRGWHDPLVRTRA